MEEERTAAADEVGHEQVKAEYAPPEESFTLEDLDRRMNQLLEVQKQLAQRDPVEEFTTAMLLDRPNKIEELLENHPDLAKDYSWNRIYSLALSGKPNLVKMALSKGADVNTPGKDGLPALVSACRTKSTTYPEIWKTLLEHNVDLHASDGHFTPLQKAINNEDAELIEALIQHGVDPNASDDKGTPLYFSLHMNCISSFHALLKCGADPNVLHRGQPMLSYLPQHREIQEAAEVAEAMIANGAPLDAKDDSGFTPFLVAVSHGRLDLMKLYHKHGADLNVTDSHGGNGLWVFINSAIGVYYPECAEWLLEQGVDMNQMVGKYETPATRLQKFVTGITNNEVYIKIGDVFKKFNPSFEPSPQDPTFASVSKELKEEQA